MSTTHESYLHMLQAYNIKYSKKYKGMFRINKRKIIESVRFESIMAAMCKKFQKYIFHCNSNILFVFNILGNDENFYSGAAE